LPYELPGLAIDAPHGVEHASRLTVELALDVRVQPALAAAPIDDPLRKFVDRALESEEFTVAFLLPV
jgi:hypothetical protein